MMDWLTDTAGLTPHGFCIAWEPGLLLWTIVGDGATALAYVWIAAQLAVAVHRSRRDGRLVLSERSIVVRMFAAFILLCGMTHMMHLVTLFLPLYRAQTIVTLATAAVSVTTAGTMQWLFRSEARAMNHDLRNPGDGLERAGGAVRQAGTRRDEPGRRAADRGEARAGDGPAAAAVIRPLVIAPVGNRVPQAARPPFQCCGPDSEEDRSPALCPARLAPGRSTPVPSIGTSVLRAGGVSRLKALFRAPGAWDFRFRPQVPSPRRRSPACIAHRAPGYKGFAASEKRYGNSHIGSSNREAPRFPSRGAQRERCKAGWRRDRRSGPPKSFCLQSRSHHTRPRPPGATTGTPAMSLMLTAAVRLLRGHGYRVFPPQPPPAVGTRHVPTRTTATARTVRGVQGGTVTYQQDGDAAVSLCSLAGWHRWVTKVRASQQENEQ